MGCFTWTGFFYKYECWSRNKLHLYVAAAKSFLPMYRKKKQHTVAEILAENSQQNSSIVIQINLIFSNNTKYQLATPPKQSLVLRQHYTHETCTLHQTWPPSSKYGVRKVPSWSHLTGSGLRTVTPSSFNTRQNSSTSLTAFCTTCSSWGFPAFSWIHFQAAGPVFAWCT